MEFTWNTRKNLANKAKHGVSFEEACTAFYDPLSRVAIDGDHSQQEERFVLIGISAKGNLLVVSHTESHETVRIISARVVNKRERLTYEET
jgi:uncharacterized DUF497 family protein